MEDKTARGLNKRALTAVVSLISGTGLPFSGLAIHLFKSDSSHGALHLSTVTHEVLGMVFAASTTWHIILNRKTLINHVWGSSQQVHVNREVLWATVLVGAILLVALSHTLFAY